MRGVAQQTRKTAAAKPCPAKKREQEKKRAGAGNHHRIHERDAEHDPHAPRILLQRACACGGSCDECKKKKEPPLLRYAAAAAPATIPNIVHRVLSSPGRPLDLGTRMEMEQHFDTDFSAVSVHDDDLAAQSARAVNALAYTVGQDIVFDSGRYAPHTGDGKKLLAHELAHTIQQRGLQRSSHSATLPSATEEKRLESEADHAAERALAGARVPRVSRGLAFPRLSRTPRQWAGTTSRTFTVALTWPQLAGDYDFVVTARSIDPEVNGVAFLVDRFYIPVNKRFAQAGYSTAAAGGSLEAHLIFDTGNAAPARQGDDATPALVGLWLQRVNWPAAQQHLLWHLSGGCPAPASPVTAPMTAAAATAPATAGDFGRVTAHGCDVDHVRELQIGGNNIPDNMFMLDPDWNQDAGLRFTWPLVGGLGRQVRNAYYPDDPRPTEITLSFRNNIVVRGNPAQAGVPPVNPNTYDRARCLRDVFGGRATECWQVELCSRRLLPAEITAVTGGVPPTGAPTRLFPLRMAEFTVNVTTSPRGAAEIAVPLSPAVGAVDAANAAAADLISGLELTRLTVRPETSRRRGTRDLVEAVIDQRSRAGRQRRTAPSMQELADQGATIRLNREPVRTPVEGAPDDIEGRLTLLNPRQEIRFRYPGMSEIRMAVSIDAQNRVSGRGTLTPSIPLLNRHPMNIEFGEGRMRAFYGTRPGSARAIPGGRITELSLGAELMPEFRPAGRLAMEFGPAQRPLGNVLLEATADDTGLVLTGDLFVQIPGTDRSQGHLEYRNSQWSGFVVVESTQIRLPGFQRGQLRVDFNPDGTIRPSGSVDLLVLGNPVSLNAAYERNRLVLTGNATLSVPGIHPVNVTLRHDGEHLSGSAQTGFTIAGVNGNIRVSYRDGRVSGEGTASLQKGRANGSITLRISEAGNLSGTGTATVRLTDNLVGTVGIDKPERGPVRVTGELAFPNPITLFRAVNRSHTLFERSVDFPIPGLSIPVVNVGVIATISGRLSAGYGFGPGTLQNVRVAVGFNPLEEATDLAVDASAQLAIPAHVELSLSIRAAAGLSAGVARVTGGITGTGTVGLQGGFTGGIAFHLRNSIYIVEAEAAIRVRPIFRLGLDADVTAEVGAFGYVAARWQKVWNLYNFAWGADAEAGLIARLRYASNEGFTLPSPENIQWIMPRIEPGGVLASLFGGARSQQRDIE